MSAVSEWIVREYFESLGFLVRQPRKYMVSARAKRADEEIDLIVFNPHAVPDESNTAMIWTSEQTRQVGRAIVGIRGWHTERFSPAVLQESPEIYRFDDEDVGSHVPEALGVGRISKILCLPGLPASDDLKAQTLEILGKNGIDGVLLFRTMLMELLAGVEINKSYEKSDLLQILRIMKNYDLVKDPQLEFFGKRRR